MTEESKAHPYIEWAKNRLDEMDATLSALESKAGELETDVSAKAEEALADMRRQRDAFHSYLNKNLESAESVWKQSMAQLKNDWATFEKDVQSYVDSSKHNVEQYEAAFKARADVQMKAWQTALNEALEAAVKFPQERKADVEKAIDGMKSEAKAAEARLEAMKKAGEESWSALDAALSDSRRAFEKATENMQEAFKRAWK